MSGNHAAIARWRRQQALGRTWLRRPDLVDPEQPADRSVLSRDDHEPLRVGAVLVVVAIVVSGGNTTIDHLRRAIAEHGDRVAVDITDTPAFTALYDRMADVVFGVIRRVLRDPALLAVPFFVLFIDGRLITVSSAVPSALWVEASRGDAARASDRSRRQGRSA